MLESSAKAGQYPSSPQSHNRQIAGPRSSVDGLIDYYRTNIESQFRRKKKIEKNASEAIEVHLMKLEDLPDPLSRREFREICQREGIPIGNIAANTSQPMTGSEAFDQFKDIQQRRVQERWNNTVSNLFGAYLGIYDLFKSWHSSIIQQRHIGPSTVKEHEASKLPRPPFTKPTKPNLTDKEMQHLMKQKKLVNLLIQYGIGMLNKTDKEQNQRHDTTNKDRAQTSSRLSKNLARVRSGSPMSMNTHNYGPIADQKMIKESLQHHNKLQGRSTSNLQVPPKANSNLLNMANQIPISDPMKRRFSFAISEDSRNANSSANIKETDSKNGSVMVDVDVYVRNNDDVEYFNQQNEIELTQKAHERLRLITTTPEGVASNINQVGAFNKKQRIVDNTEYEDSKRNQASLTLKDLNNESEFFSPMHKRLRKELIETREQLSHCQQMLEKAEKRNLNIISKYTKDEVARSVNSKILRLPYPEQAESIKNQIESKFYNVADGLEPHVVQILNTKLAQIKDYFIGQIQLIAHHTDSLRQNVALMESMNKDGMKFEELNTEKLIERSAILEESKRDQLAQLRVLDPTQKGKAEMNRPQVIWNLLQQHFGIDYFLEVIEEEYGIAPGANELFASQISMHFDQQVLAYKVEQMRMQNEAEEQIEILRAEVESLTEEKYRLMRHDKKYQTQQEKEMRVNLTMLFKSQEEAIIKSWKNKVKNGEQVVQEMNKERENAIRSDKGYQKNYAWKRWQMFNMMKTIISNVNENKVTGIDEKMLALAEKFINEEYLVLRYSEENGIPTQLARIQMHEDRILKWKLKYEESEANYGWYSNLADQYQQRVEEFRSELEFVKRQNVELKHQLPHLKSSNKLLYEACEKKEEEVRGLLRQIKTIEARWKNQTKEANKLTAKPILAALELKSLNEMSGHLIRAQKNAGRTKRGHKDTGTITELNNVEKVVEQKKMFQMKDVQAVEVQATEELCTIVDHIKPQMVHVQCGINRELEDVVQQSKVMQLNIHPMRAPPQDDTLAIFGLENSPKINNKISQLSGLAWDMTTRRTMEVKKSFGRPKLMKAESQVLGSKEFIFSNKTGLNTSQQKGREEGNSVNALKRSNTLFGIKDLSVPSVMERNRSFQRKTFVGFGKGATENRSDNNQSRRNSLGNKLAENLRPPSRDDNSEIQNFDKKKIISQNRKKNQTKRKNTANQSNLSKDQSQNIAQEFQHASELRRKSQRKTKRDSGEISLNRGGTALKRVQNDRSTSQKTGENPNNLTPTKMIQSTSYGNKPSQQTQAFAQQKMKNMTNKEKLNPPTTTSKNQRIPSNMRMSTNVDMSKGRFPDDQLSNIRKATTIPTNKNKMPRRKFDINIDVPSKKATNDDITTRQSHAGFKNRNMTNSTSTQQHVGMKSRIKVKPKVQNSKGNYSSQQLTFLQQQQQDKSSSQQHLDIARATSMNSPLNPEDLAGNKGSDFTRGTSYQKLQGNSFQEMAGNMTSQVDSQTFQSKRKDLTGTGNQPKEPSTEIQRMESANYVLSRDSILTLEEQKQQVQRNLEDHDGSGQMDDDFMSNESLQQPYNTQLEEQETKKQRLTSGDRETSKDKTSIIVSADASGHFSHLQQLKSHEKSQQNDLFNDVLSDRSDKEMLCTDSLTKQQKNSHEKKDFINDLIVNNSGSKRHRKHSKFLLKSQGKPAVSVEDLNHSYEPTSGASQRKNRLTLVQEHKDEHNHHRDSESKMSEFNKNKRSPQTKVSRLVSKLNKTLTNSNSRSHQSLVEFTQEMVNNVYHPNKGNNENQNSHQQSASAIKKKKKTSTSRLHANLGHSNTKNKKIDDGKNQSSIQKQRKLRKKSSFGSSLDSDDYSDQHYLRKNESRRTKSPGNRNQEDIYQSQNKNTQIAKPTNVTESDVEQKSLPEEDEVVKKYSKLQKLLLKGHINEEQFICLELLQKGFIPSSKRKDNENLINYGVELQKNQLSRSRSANRIRAENSNSPHGHSKLMKLINESNHKHNISQTTTGFYPGNTNGRSSGGSQSPELRSKDHQRRVSKGFIENTYRIFPNKIPVLEKIFDRVYAKKRNVGIQCDQEPNAFVVDDNGVIGINEMSNLHGSVQTTRFQSYQPPNRQNRLLQDKQLRNGRLNTQRLQVRDRSQKKAKLVNQNNYSSTGQLHFTTMRQSNIEQPQQSAANFNIQMQSRLASLQNTNQDWNQQRHSAPYLWVNSIPVESNVDTSRPQQTGKNQKIYRLSKRVGGFVDQQQTSRALGASHIAQAATTSQTHRSQLQFKQPNRRNQALLQTQPDMISGLNTAVQTTQPHNLIIPIGQGGFNTNQSRLNGRSSAINTKQHHSLSYASGANNNQQHFLQQFSNQDQNNNVKS